MSKTANSKESEISFSSIGYDWYNISHTNSLSVLCARDAPSKKKLAAKLIRRVRQKMFLVLPCQHYLHVL